MNIVLYVCISRYDSKKTKFSLSFPHTPHRASSQISQRVMKFIPAISFDNLESIVLEYVTMAMKNQETANIKRFMNL